MSPHGRDVSWTEDGRPRSERFDDIYFAPDGLDEARTVFLKGCGLPQAWAGRRRFTVAELGFGSGLNILALLQLWRDTRPTAGRLHIFSIEAYPLSPDGARRALSIFPELAELAAPLLARWPGRARGFQRVDWPEISATLDVATAEAADGLRSWTGEADAWFLDGFAPSRNPDMWRPEVLEAVRARSAAGARAATFSVAGAVRRGLEQQGFTLTRAPGHGRKKERLEARLAGAAAEPHAPGRIVVIGGGIAGASLARAFALAGASCVVLDPEPGAGASGNPAALVSPRLDVGGGPVARLYAQAFERAVAVYPVEVPDAVVARGAVRLPAGPKDQARFDALASLDLHPEGALQRLDDAAATERLGAPAPQALWIAEALTVTPARVLGAWLGRADQQRHEVGGLEHGDGTWRILDGRGELLAEAHAVVLAAGYETAAWLPDGLLEAVRGQASWTADADPPGAAASWGGYLVPLTAGGGVLFGATHARGSTDRSRRPEDDARNLTALAERLPELAAALRDKPLQSRAAVRAATPDRLPLAGAAPGAEGLFVLGGLGGRGFTTAPLLAEHVAALVLQAPSPLPRELAELVDPARFAVRARRRAQTGYPSR
jgi:tRNA 5-methylaminomethyl-2-thiouridine biosynthesis bifunctional protein